MSKKESIINVQGTAITIFTSNEDDYISLTDMLKAKDGDFSFPIGLETVILLSFLGFGKVYIIPILIMANLP